MIISGGSRSNWRFFSTHLLKTKDNARVHIVEMRGLLAEDVKEALREMHAVASGTRCKNFFYHADLNPRENEQLTPEQWEQAVDTLERNLGLDGHARFVVEHEKNGRTHQHVVWNRINPETMTAVSDSHNYAAHERTARELERTFGHEAVQGVHIDRDGPRPGRRPKDWETFRAQQTGIDPQQVKEEITELWNQADSGKAFAAALEEHGYILCKGDRRDFCIVDRAGDEHSLARRIDGARAAEIRARLADIDRDTLPTVAEGRDIAQENAAGEGGRQESRPELEPAAPGDPLRELARQLHDAMPDEQPAPPWTHEEFDAAWTHQGNRDLSAREQLDALGAAYAEQLREHGEIQMRDGITWTERAQQLVEHMREAFEQGVGWVKERWESFVDYLDRTRDDGRGGPDIER